MQREPELVAAPGDFAGFRWAEPNHTGLREALREVFTGINRPFGSDGARTTAVIRARAGWQQVHKRFNHQAVGELVGGEIAAANTFYGLDLSA